MAIKHDLYVQLDPKDLKKGLASFFHAKKVDDGGAWNSRTKSLNSNRSDSIVVDFGEDTPYTDIFWKDNNNQKWGTPIVDGKVSLPTNINYNDVQLYAASVDKFYTWGNRVNNVTGWGYDDTHQSGFSNSSKTTWLSTTDFYNGWTAYPYMFYPKFQVYNEVNDGRNTIGGYSDRYKPIRNEKSESYWLDGSIDNSKAFGSREKYHAWGFLTGGVKEEKIIHDPLNDLKDGYYRILLSYDASNSKLTIKYYGVKAKNTYIDIDMNQLRDSYRCYMGVENGSMNWHNKTGADFYVKYKDEKTLSAPYVTLIVTESAPGTTIEYSSYSGNKPITENEITGTLYFPTMRIYKDHGIQEKTIEPSKYSSGKVSYNADIKLYCGKTYRYTIDLLKYPSIYWSGLYLQTLDRYMPISIYSSDGATSFYGTSYGKYDVAGSENKICVSPVKKDDIDEKSKDWKQMDSWSSEQYCKIEELDNQGRKNISVNYTANTARTTLTKNSSYLSATNEISEFVSSFSSSYEVLVPSIYTIFGHAGDFAIYSVDGYLPARSVYYKPQPQWYNYHIYSISPFYCVTYNGKFNQSFGGLGDVGIAYDIECFGGDKSTPMNYTYGGISPYWYFNKNAENLRTIKPMGQFEHGGSFAEWIDTKSFSHEPKFAESRSYLANGNISTMPDFLKADAMNSIGLPAPHNNISTVWYGPYEGMLDGVTYKSSSGNYRWYTPFAYQMHHAGWFDSNRIGIISPRFFLNRRNIETGSYYNYTNWPNTITDSDCYPYHVEILYTGTTAPGICGIIGPVA